MLLHYSAGGNGANAGNGGSGGEHSLRLCGFWLFPTQS